jgi:hypothetical protein
MCDQRKTEDPRPPTEPTAEQIAALIGIARQAAIDQMAEIVRRVLDAALIDDRAERLQAIAKVCARYELEQQHCPANRNSRAGLGGLRG